LYLRDADVLAVAERRDGQAELALLVALGSIG
jgi:hypothetical protein